MRNFHAFLLALSMAASAWSQSTVPAQPDLTAGAEFKGLRFDWEPAAGASWYELEYKAHQNSAFVQLGSDFAASVTSFRYRFPLHLFDWTYARYRLAACNSAGCSRSPEVSVSTLRRHAVGYIKSEQPLIGYRFGDSVDLSPNGLNFVVAEPGNLGGVGGLTEPPGAIYVYRRTTTEGFWFRRGKLQSTIPAFIEGSNQMNVGISADGDTVVLGMPNYFHEEFDEQSGEVFVYRVNNFEGRWDRVRLYSGARGMFGRWVVIDDSGTIIAVATGGAPGSTPPQVLLYRYTNGSWQPVRSIGSRPGEGCDSGSMSADGSTVAEVCAERDSNGDVLRHFVRTYSGTNWTIREDIPLALSIPSDSGYSSLGLTISSNGDTIAAQIQVAGPQPDFGPSRVQVFTRNAGVYAKVAELAPGAWRSVANSGFFGLGLSLSGDGRTLAIGDSWDNGLGLGPRAAPLNPGTARTGAVYVYRLGSSWRLANMIKPNRVDDTRTFGRILSLNGNGHTLLLGYPVDSSDSAGIGGDWGDTGSPSSGAIFIY